MRRAILLVTVAVLVSFGGCTGGGVGNGTPTTTATETTTTGSAGFAFPPGAGSDGITDPDALLEAHREALAAASYDVVLEYELGGSGFQHVLVRSDPVAQRAHVVMRQPGSVSEVELYVDGTVTRQRRVLNGTAEYTTIGNERPFDEQHRLQLGEGFAGLATSAGQFELAEVINRDGRRVAVYTLSDYDPAGDTLPASADAATATVVVDERGVIAEATLHVEHRVDGESVVTEAEYRVVRLGGVTVAEPAWLAEFD